MFNVGDLVRVEGRKYAGVWTVKKVNPTTYKLTRDGTILNASHSLVLLVGTREPQAATPYVPMAHFTAGSFVRYNGAPQGTRLSRGDVFVVLADKGEKVNCTPIGGDNDRYWRFPKRSITSITVNEALDTWRP